jgi:hypothetical protein
MPLRLHAITPYDAHIALPLPANGDAAATVVPFRELGAIVTEQAQFAVQEPQPADLDAHREIVDDVFRRSPLLPAPPGVVFRTRDVLTRWMELHYVALTDAIGFVEDRSAARLHITAVPGKETDAEAVAAASEVIRAIRRRAVASVPLGASPTSDEVLRSVAFLVDRVRWKEFVAEVSEQRKAHAALRLEISGPWAPYDFVRMQFGD